MNDDEHLMRMKLSTYTKLHLKFHTYVFQYEFKMLFSTKYRLELLKRYVSDCFNERTIARYATRHRLLVPKYMRKVSWRLMVKAMPREIEDSFRAGV